MLFLEDALEKFADLDPEVIFAVNSDRVIASLKQLAEKYGVSFESALLFLVVGDLPETEIADYLVREAGLDEKIADQATQEFLELVAKPLSLRLGFLNADPDKEFMSLVQEKEYLRKIFKEDLLVELKDSPFLKNAFNFRIFDILEKDINFKRELERLLYDNNERVTANNIVVSGQTVAPTIANWLRDFINTAGSANFNSVVFSNYLVNSANTKNLTPEERSILADLISVYKNLKFFEEEVEGRGIDDWRILPFSVSELKQVGKTSKTKEISKKSDKKSAEEILEKEVTVNSLDEKLSSYDWPNLSPLETRAILESLGITLKDFKNWHLQKYGK